jgi:uncharacterized Zn-binding protein involved in type VI secretion
MGVTPLEAARIGDQIEHSFAMTGLLAGLVVGLVVTGALLLAAGATVATGGAAAVVIGGLIAGVAGGGLAGMKIGSLFTGKKGPIIAPGSPNTFIGSDAKKAARAIVDQVLCADHKMAPIATGALDVYINMQPAARKTDKTACDGKICEGHPDVFFGGPTGQYLPISSEVPGWLVTTLEWAAIIGTVIATGGAILTVGFGAALGGLAGGYLGGLAGAEIGGRVGEHFFGEKGKVIGEVLGEFVGSTLGSTAGEKIGARIEGSLPSSILAKLPGETATNTLKTRMSDPANFAPGENPAFWTGPGSRDAANANGNSTMEHTVGGQATEGYVNNQRMVWDQSKGVWVESSTQYANQVGSQYGTMDPNTGLPITGPNSGKPVTVYVSESANPNSVYFTTEKPLLQSYGVNIVEVIVPAPKP